MANLGYRIFKWLLVLAALLLAALGIYAWQTYPSLSSISTLLPANATATDRIAAWQNLRTGWLQQVKDLGQLFVLTPVFPLIAAVIGYIFGVRKAAREGGEGDQRTVTEPTDQPVSRDASDD